MKFSIKEAFVAAFNIFRQNFFGIFSFSLLCFMVTETFPYFIYHYFKAPIYFQVLSVLASCYVNYVCTSTFLLAFRGSEIKFKTFFLVSRKDLEKVIFKYLLGNILLSFLVLVPIVILSLFLLPAIQSSPSVSTLFIISLCILLIFVWFVLLFRYCFFHIDVLEVKLVFQSFRNSAKLVSGNICKLFLLLFLLILMNLLVWIILYGMLIMVPIIANMLLIIGMSFTLPFSILVWIHVYTQLSSYKSNSEQIHNN